MISTTLPRRTALITGASGGIGEELAKVFAANRFDLVLTARSAAKLQALAEELSRMHNIRAEALAADLADLQSPPRLVQELAERGRTVDVLVNNAGVACFGDFVQIDPAETMNMVHLNIVTLTHLTRLLLPGMIARGSGRILNLASTAAFMPGPLMSVYYASKAYVLSFSVGLNEELRGSGVRVTALCPGPTVTGFQARANMEQSRLMRGPLMDAASVAQIGYEGLMRGQAIVVPGLLNKIMVFFPRLLPRTLLARIVRRAQERVGHG